MPPLKPTKLVLPIKEPVPLNAGEQKFVAEAVVGLWNITLETYLCTTPPRCRLSRVETLTWRARFAAEMTPLLTLWLNKICCHDSDDN